MYTRASMLQETMLKSLSAPAEMCSATYAHVSLRKPSMAMVAQNLQLPKYSVQVSRKGLMHMWHAGHQGMKLTIMILRVLSDTL
jgi:hypothetical protein